MPELASVQVKPTRTHKHLNRVSAADWAKLSEIYRFIHRREQNKTPQTQRVMGRPVEQPSPEAYSVRRLPSGHEVGNGTEVGAVVMWFNSLCATVSSRCRELSSGARAVDRQNRCTIVSPSRHLSILTLWPMLSRRACSKLVFLVEWGAARPTAPGCPPRIPSASDAKGSGLPADRRLERTRGRSSGF